MCAVPTSKTADGSCDVQVCDCKKTGLCVGVDLFKSVSAAVGNTTTAFLASRNKLAIVGKTPSIFIISFYYSKMHDLTFLTGQWLHQVSPSLAIPLSIMFAKAGHIRETPPGTPISSVFR